MTTSSDTEKQAWHEGYAVGWNAALDTTRARLLRDDKNRRERIAKMNQIIWDAFTVEANRDISDLEMKP